MQKQGFKPAWLWTSLTILGEVGGGLSLAFGFLTPLGAAGAVGTMFMAIVKAHWKHGFWNRDHGLEFPLDRKSTRLNSSHTVISYAVFCLKKKNSKSRLGTPLRPGVTRPRGKNHRHSHLRPGHLT